MGYQGVSPVAPMSGTSTLMVIGIHRLWIPVHWQWIYFMFCRQNQVSKQVMILLVGRHRRRYNKCLSARPTKCFWELLRPWKAPQGWLWDLEEVLQVNKWRNNCFIYFIFSWNVFFSDIIKEDVVEEHEIESFLTEFTALLRLLQSELRLMLGIVPLPHQKAVLSIILRDALEMICHDAEVGNIWNSISSLINCIVYIY